MSVYYNGSHSITFVRINDELTKKTWDDFHLVPSEKPYISPPKPSFKYTNLPRSMKILDLTESLNGLIEYEASEGSWKFYIDHDKWDNIHAILEKLGEYFDGTMFRVILDDESEVSYTGTVQVESYDPENDYSTITLSYSLNWYVEDTIPVQNDEPSTIVIPRIGSGSDYYQRIPILRQQIIPITDPAHNVYYLNVDYNRASDTYTTEIKKYEEDFSYEYGDGIDPYIDYSRISEAIDIIEDAQYPNHPFDDEKYLGLFTIGIKATWVRPVDGYFSMSDSGSGGPFGNSAEHFNVRNYSSYNDGAGHYAQDGNRDYDNPFDMETGVYHNDDWVDGPFEDGVKEIDNTVPFRIALKITAANDENYINGYMTFGSGSYAFNEQFIEHIPKSIDKQVEVQDVNTVVQWTPITTSVTGKVSGGPTYGTRQVKRTLYKYSDGYWETDKDNLYRFNLKGDKNYSSFYIENGPSNQKDYYKRKGILNEFDLNFLYDEYGLEFDTTKLYLFRSAKAGPGRYLVSIDRYA